MAPTIQKILIPTDFSVRSDHAIDYGAALAATLKASIHLLHVIEEPFVGWDLYVRDAQEVRERLHAAARSRLSDLGASLEKRGFSVDTEIRHGSAPDGIVNAAAAGDADVIVMSTHGRSGLPHLLLGSVAERVIRSAHCPVLAVRESRREQTAALEGTTAA